MMNWIIGLLVVAVLGLLVSWIVRVVKRQQAELEKALRQAGFYHQPELDSATSAKIEHLLGHFKGGSKLTDVYRYSGQNYDLYRFAVRESGGNQEHRFAMVFRQPRLPGFTLIPVLKLPGFLKSIVTRLFEYAVSRHGYTEVEVAGRPQFRERYRLYAGDGREIARRIPADCWSRVSALPQQLFLQGDGDVLLIQELPGGRSRAHTRPEAELRRIIEYAEALYAVFRDVPATSIAI